MDNDTALASAGATSYVRPPILQVVRESPPVTILEKKRAAARLPLNQQEEEVVRSLGGTYCACSPESNGHMRMPIAPAGSCPECGTEGPMYRQALEHAKLNGRVSGLYGIEREYEQLELFGTSGLLSGVRSGKWLQEQDFPELEYVIPGLIPEGLTLLIGPPKAGKSWMLLALCLAVSSGGIALNAIRTGEPKRVLYLALEDGDRRMQSRCRSLLGDKTPIPEMFHYVTTVRPGQMHALLAEFLGTYPETGMIVIDTLGKVMPDSRGGESSYQRDYRVASEIKRIADDKPGLAVLVAHHDRKAASEDFVDAVSGTHGLAGAADTITVLCRKRQSPEAVLKVTGRDVPEREYALVLDSSQSWRLAGHDLESAASEARNRSDREGLGDLMNQVWQVIKDRPEGIRRAEVAKMFPDVTNVDMYLGRLVSAGRIDKMERGVYVPLGN